MATFTLLAPDGVTYTVTWLSDPVREAPWLQTEGVNADNNVGLIKAINTAAINSKNAIATGIVPPRVELPNVTVGSVALASLGNETTDIDGTLWVTSIVVPFAFTCKGGAWLNGATVTTDKHIVALYNSTGALLANSATAGAADSGAHAFQKADFLTPVVLTPGIYYLGVQSKGTTDTFQTVAASTFLGLVTGNSAGTFGTIPTSIAANSYYSTPAFNANKGPIGFLYN